MFNQNTIPAFLYNRVRNVPNNVAFSFPEHNQHYTWAQLWQQVRLVSEGFIRLGINKGDRIAILMEGRIELISSMLAAVSVGAIAVPVNTYSKPQELKTLFLDARPALFVIGTAAHHIHYSVLMHEVELVSTFDKTNRSWLPAHLLVQGASGELPAPFRHFEELLEGRNTMSDELFAAHCRSTTSDEPAFLLYTSGSTGIPKGVLRSTASFLVGNDRKKEGVGGKFKSFVTQLSDRYTGRYAVMALLPLYHLGGLGILFTSLKACNIRTVLLTRFHPVHALQAAEKERCKFLIGTPYMIQSMLSVRPSQEIRLDHLLGIAFTSSAVNYRMIEKITGQFKNLYFFMVSYGSSEAGAVANGTCFMNRNGNLMVSLFLKLLRSTNLLNGEIAYEEFSRTPYSIGGKVDKHVEVRIRDMHTGEILPVGQKGEIMVRSHRVMRYASDHLVKETFLEDGWYRSGDIGYLDERGYLFIVDRVKRIISRGGEKISPAEVEEAILKNPAVSDAFVFGLADELYGELVCAAYVEKEGVRISVSQLQTELSACLSQFKVPKHYISFPAFPISATGKIAGEEIKRAATQQISKA